MGHGGKLAVEAVTVALENGVVDHRGQRITLQILQQESVADAGIVSQGPDHVVRRRCEAQAAQIQEIAILLLPGLLGEQRNARVVVFVEFCHNTDPALSLFIEIDGLGIGKLEDPVDRTGGDKSQLRGDMPLYISVKWVAMGEVAEVGPRSEE